MIRRVLLLSASISFSVFGALSVAHATTINVTTLQDEDGENLKSCSLREAIKASGTKAAYGGCKAGQKDYTDTIQLTTDTYTLTRGELVMQGDMVILGGADVDIFSLDPITGTSPRRPAVVTTIVAASGSRIFNSTASNDQINLSNMILRGGVATDFGGSIRAGGLVSLSRVHITGATANKQGGAIYLEGSQSTLTAIASSFTGNNAPSGAVVGMSCFDNIIPTVRTLTLSQVSLTGNGLSGTSSILDFCGESTSTITGSTIAQNSAQNSDTSGLAPAIVRYVGDINTRLGRTSSLKLISNTVVENNADVVLAYGLTSGLTLSNNILGFNNSVQDCKYTGPNDSGTGAPPVGTLTSYNLLSSVAGTAATSKCQLYPLASAADTNIYSTSANVLSDYVSPLGFYGISDLLGYLPKVTSTTILDKGSSTLSCGSVDQRGLARSSGVPQTGNTAQVIKCDIGALELSVLTVNDDVGGVNTSYDSVVNTAPVDTSTLTDSQIKTLNANNAAYISAYKSSHRYREVVMDIVANDFTQEAVSGNTSVMDLLSDSTKYTITGSDSANGNIHCEWNPVMKQMLASRQDGEITPSGDTDTCTYTITNLAGGAPKTAKMSFVISNIAPIAKDDALVLPFGTKSIPLNILANDSDDGDGPVGDKNYPVGKTPFYEDKRLINGVVVRFPVNIRFVTKPTQGHIVAQYQEACPDNNVNTAATICYGGTMTYVNDNLFSPFNDSFTYQVLDSDLTASNTATVTITNTATTTDKKKAGGGSFGLGALFGLLSLVFIRRRMVN